MEILTPALGPYETNCYIIIDNGCAVVIDPAADAEVILEVAEKKGAHIKKILLTHGHLDHISACADAAQASGAAVYVHEADYPMIADKKTAYPQEPILLNRFEPVSDGIEVNFVSEGDKIKEGDIELEVLETPGHSRGSVMYVLRSEKVIFTGDTVFYMTVGRCDTNTEFGILVDSVNKLADFGRDFALYPGHGPLTKLGFEIENNPYLRKLK